MITQKEITEYMKNMIILNEKFIVELQSGIEIEEIVDINNKTQRQLVENILIKENENNR
jgi:hypothetical protein